MQHARFGSALNVLSAQRLLGSAHERAVHRRRISRLAKHFAELIPSDHSVLDVGCGDGRIARELAHQRPDLIVHGVDPLVRSNAQIPVIRFDGLHLPFKDKTWDTVLLCDVLHHTDLPMQLLVECARVARTNVVIKDHVATGVVSRLLLRLMDFVGNAPHNVPLAYNYLSARDWQHAYDTCGLIVQSQRHNLQLYPSWAEPIFGNQLHFVAMCEIVTSAVPHRPTA